MRYYPRTQAAVERIHELAVKDLPKDITVIAVAFTYLAGEIDNHSSMEHLGDPGPWEVDHLFDASQYLIKMHQERVSNEIKNLRRFTLPLAPDYVKSQSTIEKEAEYGLQRAVEHYRAVIPTHNACTLLFQSEGSKILDTSRTLYAARWSPAKDGVSEKAKLLQLSRYFKEEAKRCKC